MRLAEVQLKNFRIFFDQTIKINDYTALVGPNGSGKSALLTALNIFFRNTTSSVLSLSTLNQEDFHKKDTTKPIEIILTFKDLSDQAKEDFKAYYRQEKLVVAAKAVWDPASNAAVVYQCGHRHVMDDFSAFLKGYDEGEKVSDLIPLYQQVRKKYPTLPDVKVKKEMHDALREHEEKNPSLCIMKESKHEFYGWSKGANKLAKYIQWVYVPAVKEASTEQEENNSTALGQLLARTIRAKVNFKDKIDELKGKLEKEYLTLLEEQKGVLEGLSASLSERLRGWTHSGTNINLNWHYDESRSIVVQEPKARVIAGEDQFVGEIARLGHGLQRAVFLSLLQELATLDQENAPRLILGFEEPELYQHPPQARHMADVLEKLTDHNTQLLITTHSPYFISSKNYTSVRYFRKRKESGDSIVGSTDLDKISSRIASALGEPPASLSSMMAIMEQIMQPSQNELFFTSFAVIVEGIEDIAYLATHMQLNNKWNEFRKLGCHFIVGGGKINAGRLLVVAQELSIPNFIFFDSDAHKAGDSTERENTCLLNLCGHAGEKALPDQSLFKDNLTMWATDIGTEVRKEFGDAFWSQVIEETRKEKKLDPVIGNKNTILIVAILEKLASLNKSSKILGKLADNILELAKKAALIN